MFLRSLRIEVSFLSVMMIMWVVKKEVRWDLGLKYWLRIFWVIGDGMMLFRRIGIGGGIVV